MGLRSERGEREREKGQGPRPVATALRHRLLSFPGLLRASRVDGRKSEATTVRHEERHQLSENRQQAAVMPLASSAGINSNLCGFGES